MIRLDIISWYYHEFKINSRIVINLKQGEGDRFTPQAKKLKYCQKYHFADKS